MIPPELLIQAYRGGAFPMAMEDGEIGWFSPDPRALIPLDDGFHVPHGLRRVLKKAPFEIRINTQFEQVIRGCARRSETWIDQQILDSYCELHRLGHAHSVEAYREGCLVGGLYGVAIGGAFFGESMYHEVTDASKVALHALVMRLREREFSLLDTQWSTPHLQTFGVRQVRRSEYRALLARCIDAPCRFAERM